MKPSFYPALRLLAFPALLAPGLLAQEPPAGHGPDPESLQSPTVQIEQKVLIREAGSTTQSIVELAMAVSRSENTGDKNRLQSSLAKYALWLSDLNDQLRQIGLLSDDMSEQLVFNAAMLNEVGWHMLIAPEFSDSPREIPRHIAAVAVSWSEDDPAYLDTYARALALTGDMGLAIDQQQKAVEAGKKRPAADGVDFQATLDAYQKGEVPAAEGPTGWRDDLIVQEDTNTDATRLNDIAWGMVASDKQSTQTALKVVTVAIAMPIKSRVTLARILNTRARALYQAGNRQEAISVQQTAVSMCRGDATLRESLKETLAQYREGETLDPYGKEGRFKADYETDSVFLNDLAWKMLQDEKAGSPAVAQELALAARSWLEDKRTLEPQITDTIALTYFKMGEISRAIEMQKIAVQLATENPEFHDDALLEQLKATLKSYEDQRVNPNIPLLPPGTPMIEAPSGTRPRPRSVAQPVQPTQPLQPALRLPPPARHPAPPAPSDPSPVPPTR